MKNINTIENQSEVSLRDYFAGKAMQGLMSTQHIEGSPNDENVAIWAYRVADAMLAERIKDK